jgi:hypothetical protein
MDPVSFSVRPAFGAAIFALVVACGGTSVSQGGGGGMAGMSASGGSSGAAGTSGHAGAGGKGGSGGTGATGGSGATGGTGATGGSGAIGGSGGSSGSTGGSGTGGSGAFSGSGGASGSGGTGGTPECVLGGMCTQGSSCTESGCCPCTLKCSNGAWAQAECATCGQVGCPDTPPNNGDPCSLCAVSPSCSWDERPTDGPLYTATCVDDRWHVDMQWAYCCKADADCGTGVCVNSACKPASSDQCWTDAQCSADYVCSGAVVCECGQLCGAPDQAGTCVPKDRTCCVSDTDCADDGECVQGVCKERPTGFACCSVRDCLGGICVAPNLCPCGSDCLVADAPGNCAFP